LIILAQKKIDYGQKIRFSEKEVGNFSTSKRPRNWAFQKFEESVLDKEAAYKRIFRNFESHFLTIFVNLRKRLESAVLAGQYKFFSKIHHM
jgi:hypothetical protein